MSFYANSLYPWVIKGADLGILKFCLPQVKISLRFWFSWSQSQDIQLLWETARSPSTILGEKYHRLWWPPGGSVVKNPPANAGEADSIHGLGRSPGEGNGNSLQYSCLGNPDSWTEEPQGLQSMGCEELDMTEQLSNHHHRLFWNSSRGRQPCTTFYMNPVFISLSRCKCYWFLLSVASMFEGVGGAFVKISGSKLSPQSINSEFIGQDAA